MSSCIVFFLFFSYIVEWCCHRIFQNLSVSTMSLLVTYTAAKEVSLPITATEHGPQHGPW